MKTVLLIFLGGGIGSVFRYLTTKLIPIAKGAFPWPTLIVNLLGCLLIGLFIGWSLKTNSLRSNHYFFIAVGFFGTYHFFYI